MQLCIRHAQGFLDAIEAKFAIRALGGITVDGASKGVANFAAPRIALANDEDLNFFFPYDIVPPQGLIYLVGVLLPYTGVPTRPAGVGVGCRRKHLGRGPGCAHRLRCNQF